jgi:acetyl esterase/lipase
MKALNCALRLTLKPILATFPINHTTLAYPRQIIDKLSMVIPNDRQSSIIEFMIEEMKADFVQNKYYNADDNSKCRVILYLHGGAYIAGSPTTHRAITTRLARWSDCRVLAVDYRKAPEHKFPCAIKDAVTAYKWLLEKGYAPENIALCGDSAGGALCILLSLELQRLGLPKPCCQVLFSPWTNLAADGESHTGNSFVDPYLPACRMAEAANLFSAMDKKDPRISPLYADLTGLEPTLIHVSSNEIILSDSVDFQKKAVRAGVDAHIEVFDDCCHVWQFFLLFDTPESVDSLRKTVAFMKKYWRD